MKRVTNLIVLIIITLFIMTTTIYAATPSFSIELGADKTTVARGEEVTVTLKVKDFANMTEGLYAFFTQIEYDKNYFEELAASSISGKGTWSSAPTFNASNNQLTADSGTGVKTNSEVFSIKFKVKADAVEGGTTTIKVKNFQASEGDSDINANQDATINIKIGTNSNTDNNNSNNNNGNTDNNNNSNNDNGDTNNNNNSNNDNGDTNNNNNSDNNNGGTNNNNNSNNNNSGTNNNNSSNNNSNTNNNTSTDKSQATTKLPQTGEEKHIVIAIISVIVLGTFAYIKYRKYEGIK